MTHDAWTSLTSTSLTYPDGRQVKTRYDALYRKKIVTDAGGLFADWDYFGNRVVSVELANGLTC